MGQVGHDDSKMTMDVYAQLEQRVERSHGTSFDRLVRVARDQAIGFRLGPDAGVGEFDLYARLVQFAGTKRKRRYGESRTRTGDTTIFSRVLYQLSYLAARRRW